MAKRQLIMLSLIRCGQTMWDADGRVLGAADLPLSDAGRHAVEADLAHASILPTSMIYHPADEAATETAHLCALRMKAKTKAAEELGDPHLGVLEGLTEQEFAERFPTRYRQWQTDLISVSPPEGEDVVHAADRLFKEVGRILKRSRSDEIALVLHDMALGMMRCWLAERPLQDLRAMVQNRPRIERYAVPLESIASLETAGSAVYAGQ